MGKKLTIEEVKQCFLNEGYELLDNMYVNANTHLNYKCPKGHCGTMRLRTFKYGRRCPKCSPMYFSYQYVKQCLADEGYELLDSKYVNANIPLNYRCPKGHLGDIRFGNFRWGQRCAKCSKGQFEYQEVKDYFTNQGCELLESTYKNIKSSLKYKCKCGNITQTNFASFLKNERNGCKKCFTTDNFLTFKEVKEYFKNAGCILLNDTYISGAKLDYICSCGNKWQALFNNFKKGQRCKQCRYSKITGANNWRWREDREQLEEDKWFSQRVRSLVKVVFDSTGVRKCQKTEAVIGYTVKELQSYIKSHPNWNTVKNDDWHIDHIFPVKAFIEHNIFDMKLINSMDNLQPLSKFDNLAKKDKYNKEDFYKWLESKGVLIQCN